MLLVKVARLAGLELDAWVLFQGPPSGGIAVSQ